MRKIISTLVICLLPMSAFASWQLNNKASTVNFISVKKSAVAEVHSIGKLSGEIDDGKATVKLDLSSVETNIPIRNDRMKSMLFEVATFPSATITAAIDTGMLKKLDEGERAQQGITISLDLHGITKEIATTVDIIKLDDDRVVVNSIQPVIVNASDFGLDKGIEALRVVAKLPSISTAVPVTFSLTFDE